MGVVFLATQYVTRPTWLVVDDELHREPIPSLFKTCLMISEAS
jgi:hypothetical protein